MATVTSVHSDVQEYYGKKLKTSNDLQTNACCTTSRKKKPRSLLNALSLVHEDVIAKYYGCGLVFPEAVEGCRVVDLGCGSGRDCYILSKLVGEKGFVTGVDMTPEQLQVANSFIDYHTKKFGYAVPNVSFLNGYIEELSQCGISKESTDIVVSNCVINLCPDKKKALQEAFDILKVGGEMYFSDVYASKDLPQNVREDKCLYGECIGGALLWSDLIKIAVDIGFAVPILVDVAPITVDKPELQELIGDLRFCSATYRLFKIYPDDSNPLDKVIKVQYKGSLVDYPDEFTFSHDIVISKCCPVLLSASVAQLLLDSRLAPHFTFTPITGQSVGNGTCSLSEYATVDPFTVMDGVRSSCSLDTPGNSNSACCSSDNKCC